MRLRGRTGTTRIFSDGRLRRQWIGIQVATHSRATPILVSWNEIVSSRPYLNPCHPRLQSVFVTEINRCVISLISTVILTNPKILCQTYRSGTIAWRVHSHMCTECSPTMSFSNSSFLTVNLKFVTPASVGLEQTVSRQEV